MRLSVAALFAPLFLFGFSEPALAKDQREFSTGYAGVLPTDDEDLARTYFEEPDIRELVFDLEDGPVSGTRVESALSGTNHVIDDLVRVGLIRPEGDRYALAFNYFTRDDMRAIHAMIEERAPSLARAYLQRKKDFMALLENYPAKTVSVEKLLYVIVSGFSLNWDGLKASREMGFRDPVQAKGDGWQYSFWAAEADPDYSTRGFYWGSSTFPAGDFNFADRPADFGFSSFGDPYSDPRMNFPDLLYIPIEDLPPDVAEKVPEMGLQTEARFGLNIPNVLGLDWTYDIGTVLFALREGPKTGAELQSLVERKTKVPALMALLSEIQYVRKGPDCSYQLLIPVLDHSDKEMVDKALALSRDILREWLEENYPDMKAGLQGLTAMRQGVPFEALFTQIWHDLFGRVSRELAEKGFTFDPNDQDEKYQGSLGSVWRHSLIEFEIG